jgi:acetyl-CoA carboxylase alpha subunit
MDMHDELLTVARSLSRDVQRAEHLVEQTVAPWAQDDKRRLRRLVEQCEKRVELLARDVFAALTEMERVLDLRPRPRPKTLEWFNYHDAYVTAASKLDQLVTDLQIKLRG